jgi:hypothetical protein
MDLSDVSAARRDAQATLGDLQSIGDVVLDYSREFKKVWNALLSSHQEEEKCVEQVKGLMAEVEAHKAAMGDALVRASGVGRAPCLPASAGPQFRVPLLRLECRRPASPSRCPACATGPVTLQPVARDCP